MIVRFHFADVTLQVLILLFQFLNGSYKMILRFSCVTDVLLKSFYNFFVLFLKFFILVILWNVGFGTCLSRIMIWKVIFVLLRRFYLLQKKFNDFVFVHHLKIFSQTESVVLTLVWDEGLLCGLSTLIELERKLIVIMVVDKGAAICSVKIPPGWRFCSRKTGFDKAIIVAKHGRRWTISC